jgi:hypothetical protein
MTALSGASDDGAAPAVAVVVVDVVVGGVEVSNDVEVSVSTVEVSTVEVSSDAAVPHATQVKCRHVQPGNGTLVVTSKQFPIVQDNRFRVGGDGTSDIVQVSTPLLAVHGRIVEGCTVVVAGSGSATVVWLRSTRSQQTRLTAVALTDS